VRAGDRNDGGRGMISLAVLQRSFQRRVLSGDSAIVASVASARGVPAEVRLDVYAEAYRLRLRDALASTYPRLQKLTGAAEFDALGHRYLAESPSRFASVRWFGDGLAESLQRWRADEPWLGELAEWEWALAAAFDARDTPALTADRLSQVTPEQWPGLRFDAHPSLHRLRLRTNTAALFKALSDADACGIEPVLFDERQHWAIWRQDLKTHYRSLDVSEAETFDSLAAGATFADLCDLLCNWHAPDDVPMRAAALLKGWLSQGWIAG
jgi:Putative DNA-binding domain